VDDPKHGVAVERDVDLLDQIGLVHAAGVPADRARALDDEHRGPIDILRHFVHEIRQHFGEARALVDFADRGLDAFVARPRGTRRWLRRNDFRDRDVDVALVDPLVVAGNGFLHVVERTHQVALVLRDLALDLDHPVGHLLADEGERLRLEVLF
jgi:hypothetical protein